ncbi:MAG TPA: hypothetical protein VES42_22755 [Pilimelia sp.]|nr:hypothetical protein [Pilimelia sp.]
MSIHTPAAADHEPGAAGFRRAETLLDDIEYRFRLLGEGPSPVSVDGRQLGHGLPRRPIALPELSAILMHPCCDYAARDAVWRLLVAQARTGNPTWRAGAAGVAMPGLRFKAYLLGKLFTGDVQAAIVEHFLRALATVDVDRPGVVSNLLNAAFSAARKELRDQEPAASGEANFAPGSALPPAPYGHPDLVLIRAVRAGVITTDEADLIGGTYLEDTTLADYAQRTAQPRWGLYKRRAAAVARLTAAIGAGELSDSYADVIAEATLTVAPEPTGYRRRP